MSLSPEQIAMRRTGITATDVVVLASGSDWHGRTVHDLYRSKVLGVDDFQPTEATELGDELEPVVLRRAAAKLGLELRPTPGTIAHPEHRRYLATPDAAAQYGWLQAKVVGLHPAREWGPTDTGVEGLPESVLVQCAWEMFVGETEVEYVGALLGTEVRTYRIERDLDGIDELVLGLRDLADRFIVDHLDAMRPPAVDGSEGSARLLAALFPRQRTPALRASPEAEEAARTYFAATRAMKALEAEKELAKQRLVAFVGDADGTTGDGWRLKLDWREPVEVKATTRAGYRHFDCRPSKGK